MLHIGLINKVHLLRLHSSSAGWRIVAQIYELDGLDIGAAAFDRLHQGPAALFMLSEREGAGAARADLEGAALIGIEHQEGIVEEGFRQGDVRRLQIENERLRVLYFDSIGVPQLIFHHRLALFVFLGGLGDIEQNVLQ